MQYFSVLVSNKHTSKEELEVCGYFKQHLKTVFDLKIKIKFGWRFSLVFSYVI